MIDLNAKLAFAVLTLVAALPLAAGCVLEKKEDTSGEVKDAKPSTPVGDGSKDAGPETSASGDDASGSWSIAEEEAFAKIQGELDVAMKLANDRCKSSLAATIDRETFRGHLGDAEGKGNAGNYCGAAITAIDEICNTVNGDEVAAEKRRATVRAKLTAVECRWGGLKLPRSGGRVDYAASRLVSLFNSNSIGLT